MAVSGFAESGFVHTYHVVDYACIQHVLFTGRHDSRWLYSVTFKCDV
jgi:hypothetical protein